MPYEMTTIGSPRDGFTSVELVIDGELAGRVFELEAGWYVETPQLERMLEAEFVKAVLAAKEELVHYVNRKGTEMPDGLTMAGASLWLMQRDDGKGFALPG